MIAWAQEIERYCDESGANYEEIISFYDEIKFFPAVKIFPGRHRRPLRHAEYQDSRKIHPIGHARCDRDIQSNENRARCARQSGGCAR